MDAEINVDGMGECYDHYVNNSLSSQDNEIDVHRGGDVTVTANDCGKVCSNDNEPSGGTLFRGFHRPSKATNCTCSSTFALTGIPFYNL